MSHPFSCTRCMMGSFVSVSASCLAFIVYILTHLQLLSFCHRHINTHTHTHTHSLIAEQTNVNQKTQSTSIISNCNRLSPPPSKAGFRQCFYVHLRKQSVHYSNLNFSVHWNFLIQLHIPLAFLQN